MSAKRIRKYCVILIQVFAYTLSYGQRDSVEFERRAVTGHIIIIKGVLRLQGNHLLFIPKPPSFFFRDNDLIKEMKMPISEIKCIRKSFILPIQQTGLKVKMKNGYSFGFLMSGRRRHLISLVREKQQLLKSLK
jgi:hypothetical protein